MDVGCYCVSALRLLCGEPVAGVSGEQVIGGDGVDIRFAGVMRFDRDVLATFDCGMDVHRHQGIQIVGSEGSIDVPQPWQTWEGPKIVVVRGEDVETIEPPGVDPYAAELDDMAAAISTGRADPARPRGVLGQARDDRRALPLRRRGPRDHAVKWLLRGLVLALLVYAYFALPAIGEVNHRTLHTSVARAVGGDLIDRPARLPARPRGVAVHRLRHGGVAATTRRTPSGSAAAAGRPSTPPPVPELPSLARGCAKLREQGRVGRWVSRSYRDAHPW